MFSKFRKKSSETNAARFSSNLQTILMDFSIEVMPKMLSKIEDITSIIPKNTRVYIAHLEGCKIEDMIASAKKLNDDGFKVMPHIPARLIESKAALDDLIERYQGEANVTEALILAGGRTKPVGEFESSIDLLKTEVFGKNGFKHLHIAGHPEGNMDIDKDGSDKSLWKLWNGSKNLLIVVMQIWQLLRNLYLVQPLLLNGLKKFKPQV